MFQFKMKVAMSFRALSEIWFGRDHTVTVRFEQWAERLAFEWEREHWKRCS